MGSGEMANFVFFGQILYLKSHFFTQYTQINLMDPPKIISLIQLLNGGPKEGSWH